MSLPPAVCLEVSNYSRVSCGHWTLSECLRYTRREYQAQQLASASSWTTKKIPETDPQQSGGRTAMLFHQPINHVSREALSAPC